MKAMILAAGLGTRMEELTRDTPKPLLPVLGAPLIAHSLFLLYEQGFSFAAINLHYLGDQIRNYLDDFPYFELQFSYEQEILGTGGGIATALHRTALDGHFWVLNPDSLYQPDFSLKEAQQHFMKTSVPDNHPDIAPLLMMQDRPKGGAETGFEAGNHGFGGDGFRAGNGSSNSKHPNGKPSNGGPSHADSEIRSPGASTDPERPVPGKEASIKSGDASRNPQGVLPLLFSTAGQYMYTGMALLHESQFAEIAPDEPFHIVDDWRRRATRSPSGLLGLFYSGKILDAGRKAEYLAIRDNGSLFPLTYRQGLSDFMQKWKGSDFFID